jgi:predicted NBD/HSP70 family sugar kinase
MRAMPEPTRAPRAIPSPALRPHASTLLGMIWTARGISRAELSRRTALARSTVSRAVNALVASGLVSEVGVGPSRGGRRPIILQFQDDAYGVVGVELDRTRVAVALTNLRGQVHAWEERTFPVHVDPEGTRALVASLVDQCLARWHHRPERLVAIGVAVASPFDRAAADPLSHVVLPAWGGRLGFEPLGERFGVPLLVDNDANLGALAEHWWGAGRAVNDLVYLELSTGVGSGHIMGGKVYRGATGVAGEMGHLPVDLAGAPCECGLRGCLTHLVGTDGLRARIAALRPSFPASGLPADASASALHDAAVASDPLALRVIEDTAALLATAIAGMMNLLNPAMVVIGGELAHLGEPFFAPLRRAVRERLRISTAASAQIVASPLGDRAVALGAATYALEAALEDVGLFPAVRE